MGLLSGEITRISGEITIIWGQKGNEMLKTEKREIISEIKTRDPKTQQTEDGKLIWVPHRTRSQFGTDWFQMAQDTLRMINAHRNELGLEGIVVFNALMARLDFENFIQVSQKEIADELDMRASNVSRAIKRLDGLGFIRRGPKVGRSHTLQLHPSLAWKGKAQSHMKATTFAKRDGWKVIEGGQGSLDV